VKLILSPIRKIKFHEIRVSHIRENEFRDLLLSSKIYKKYNIRESMFSQNV